MENSFWNHSGHGNFVDSFKKSFRLYVESGIKKKVESDIEQAGKRMVDERELYKKIIIKHCLCKFYLYCLY